MKTISFQPTAFDRYIECSNLCINGNITVENNGGAYLGNFTPLKKREVNDENYYLVAGRWKLKNNKMGNTIQRRLKRERRIKKGLWLFLAIVIIVFVFSCSSDNDTCNCKGKFVDNEGNYSYVETELDCASQYPLRPIIKEGYFVECVTIDY